MRQITKDQVLGIKRPMISTKLTQKPIFTERNHEQQGSWKISNPLEELKDSSNINENDIVEGV